MTNKERLIAFISALKNQDQQSTKKDIEKWRAEKEQKVGSTEDTYRTLEHYKDKYRDVYASFCGNTKAALRKLEKESSYPSMTWYPTLWDCFAKPEVIEDLEGWVRQIGEKNKVNSIANPSSVLCLNRDKLEVQYKKKKYPLTDRQIEFLEKLNHKPDTWIPGTKLKEYPTQRLDKIKNSLPKPILRLVKSHTRHGYRLILPHT